MHIGLSSVANFRNPTMILDLTGCHAKLWFL